MAERKRPRRWLVVLAVLGVLLAVGAWWVSRQLEPQRLTAIVLGKAGNALQLKFAFQGVPEYALKPEPRLLIPELSVSSVDDVVFLRARRAEISLPWATITGGAPVITRIELQSPVINLPGLRRWLASRPLTPFQLPTLTKGLRIRDGRIVDPRFSITAFNLNLPRLKTGEPASLAARGVHRQDKTLLDFNVNVTAATPGLASDITVQGSGSLQQEPKPLAIKLNASGRYASGDKVFALDLASMQFDGDSPLPGLRGKASFAFGDQLRLQFDGVLSKWPAAWPALPEPLASNTNALPVKISYTGKSDLSDPISLLVQRDPTVLQASLRVSELREWLAATNASPLPPINGTLRTPSLTFDGTQLQGVEVEISDSPAPAVVR